MQKNEVEDTNCHFMTIIYSKYLCDVTDLLLNHILLKQPNYSVFSFKAQIFFWQRQLTMTLTVLHTLIHMVKRSSHYSHIFVSATTHSMMRNIANI